jgi:hypothetical protein
VPSGLQVTVDGVGYLTPASFNWTPGSSHSVGTPSPQYSPDSRTRYSFSSWSQGGTQSQTLIAPDAGTTYTATFDTDYLLDLTSSPLGSGSFQRSPPGPWYPPSQSVSITADTAAGYSFSSWAGDATGSVNPLSVTMNSPLSITGDFVVTANTITWTGAVSSDWDNPANWNPATVPAAGDIVVLNSGNVTVPPSAAFAVLNLNGGILSGTPNVIGTMNWAGGYVSAQITVAPGSTLNINGSGDRILRGGNITNLGTVVWTGNGSLVGDLDFGSVAIVNAAGALFDTQGDGAFNATATFVATLFSETYAFSNAGVFRKSAGTGNTTFGLCTMFTNTGTVEVQSGTLNFAAGYTQTSGITILSGGGLASGSTIYINGGALTGSGTINGPVFNAALLSPGSSPGTLTINGYYTQTASGELQMELAGLTPGEFDRLVVNGQATLAGTLKVTLLNGLTPALGDAFPILSFGSRSSTFAEYHSTAIRLNVANLIGGVQTNTFGLAAALGPLELHFPVGPPQAYRFQASTNLVDWMDLSTNTPANDVFRFVDPDAIGINHRFYRAVSP